MQSVRMCAHRRFVRHRFNDKFGEKLRGRLGVSGVDACDSGREIEATERRRGGYLREACRLRGRAPRRDGLW